MSADNTYASIIKGLPADWGVRAIGDLGEVVSGGTPSRGNPSYWNGDIPWATPGELTKLKSKWLTNTEEKITKKGLGESGARLLPAGSLLVTTRATLGARALNTVPATTNQGFKSICFSDPDAAEYYYYWTEKMAPELERRASGTTFLETSGGQFRQVEVPHPPRIERKTIAHILDTLDTQIRRTEEIIAKLEQVKQGLLTDLLTRGIDENGELRPSPEEAPELYKDSPLGPIPREWTTSKIGEQADLLVGPAFDSNYFTDSPEGIRLLRGVNVTRGRVRWDERITERWPNQPPMPRRYEMAEGDIVIGMDGALVGRNFALLGSSDVPSLLVQRVARLRAVTPRNKVIYMNLQTHRFANHIDSVKTHTAIPHITSQDISNFMIGLPPKEELHSIATRFSSIESRLAFESKKTKTLSRIREGLMDDLLTGSVRVTPLLEQAEQAAG